MLKNIQMDLQDFNVYLTVRKSLAPSSIRHAISRITILNKWLANKDLNQKNIELFLYELRQSGKTNNTINTYVFAINQYVEYLNDRGHKINIKIRSMKKNKSHIEVLTSEEIQLLMDSWISYGSFHGKDCSRLNQTYTTLIYLLAVTGCRYNEAVSLTPAHIKEKHVVFEHTKNREYRQIPITPHLHLLIQKELNRKFEYVFGTMTGKKIPPQNFSDDLKKRAKKCGIKKKIHPHLFRHSFATEMLVQKNSLMHIKELGGWKDLDTLQKYLHLSNKELQRAILSHPLNLWHMTTDEIIKHDLDVLQSLKSLSSIKFTHTLTKTEQGFTLEVKQKN